MALSLSVARSRAVERWEYFEATALRRLEEDTGLDRNIDAWMSHEDGQIASAAFDEDGDGKPDRKVESPEGPVGSIESGSE